MWFWRASQHRTSSTSEQLKHANDVFTCGARAGRVANLNGRFCFGFSATFFEYDGETGEGGQTVGGYSPRLGPLSLLCGSGRAHNRPASCGCSVVPPFRGETECAEHAIRDPTYYVEHNLDVAHISPVGTHVRHNTLPTAHTKSIAYPRWSLRGFGLDGGGRRTHGATAAATTTATTRWCWRHDGSTRTERAAGVSEREGARYIAVAYVLGFGVFPLMCRTRRPRLCTTGPAVRLLPRRCRLLAEPPFCVLVFGCYMCFELRKWLGVFFFLFFWPRCR